MLTQAIYRAAVVGRWIARIAGTLMALFFLAFVVGEGPPPLFRLNLQQNLHFFAMAALFVGLLLAWKWELLGGLIPLAGFVLLVLIEGVRPLTNALFLLPVTIALMNLLCWWRLRAGAPRVWNGAYQGRLWSSRVFASARLPRFARTRCSAIRR